MLLVATTLALTPGLHTPHFARAQDLATDAIEVVPDIEVESVSEEGVVAQAEEPSSQFEVATSEVAERGPNYTAAQEVFGFSDLNVFTAYSLTDIETLLKRAKSSGAGTADSPAVVYVPNGSFILEKSVVVPENILLLSEDNVEYTSSNDKQPMVKLFGSLYGGSFDGADTATQGVRFQEVAYAGKNGIVQHATIYDIKAHGLLASGAGCTNVQIIDCSITHCGMNGINALYEATISLIQGCTINDNGHHAPNGCSGINLGHSNVSKIQDCIIMNNTDKGISTYSDPNPSVSDPSCIIGEVTGCTIADNHINGVYLKPLYHIDSFTNNTIMGNPDGIVCVGLSSKGTAGASYVKNVKNNTFDGNKNSQLHARHKLAKIYVSSGNTFSGGKNAVLALDGGNISITGNNNVIQKKATGAGIDCNGGSVLIKGASTKIRNNGTHGLYVADGTVKITGDKTQVTGNRQVGLGLFSNAKVNIAGASTTIKSNKTNNVYVGKGSKLTIAGDGTIVQNAGAIGVSLKSGGVLVVKGANTVISKNKRMGICAMGASKIGIHGANTKVQSNDAQGIYLSQSTASITGSKLLVSSNKDTGIAVRDSSKLTITGKNCTINSNEKYGVLSVGKSKATLQKVKLSKNKAGDTRATEGGKIVIKK